MPEKSTSGDSYRPSSPVIKEQLSRGTFSAVVSATCLLLPHGAASKRSSFCSHDDEDLNTPTLSSSHPADDVKASVGTKRVPSRKIIPPSFYSSIKSPAITYFKTQLLRFYIFQNLYVEGVYFLKNFLCEDGVDSFYCS